MSTHSTILRAYELARLGPCKTIREIKAQLKHEEYIMVTAHLSAPSFRRELSRLCKERLAASPSVK